MFSKRHEHPTSSMSSDMPMADLMGANEMAMTFFQSQTTPLWSNSWMPKSASTYAGTCIFLLFFAIVHRLLIAFRAVVFDTNANLVSQAHLAELEKKDSFGAAAPRIQPPRVGNVFRLFRDRSEGVPFNVLRESGRSLLEVAISGVGYLLMLAVMTLNVGYFLSVLAGIFLGTFAVGRLGGNGH